MLSTFAKSTQIFLTQVTINGICQVIFRVFATLQSVPRHHNTGGYTHQGTQTNNLLSNSFQTHHKEGNTVYIFIVDRFYLETLKDFQNTF